MLESFTVRRPIPIVYMTVNETKLNQTQMKPIIHPSDLTNPANPKIIKAMKKELNWQNVGTWRKQWGVVHNGQTKWFETYADAETHLNKIACPTELAISPI